MAINTRIVYTTPQKVWDVLADGWLYPVWVVGASRMREVDDTWPQVGSRLHHSVGSWPMLLNDTTEVTTSQPGSLLGLKARARPSGEVAITIQLRTVPDGTEIVIEEDAATGPLRLIPTPLRTAGLSWRNTETLRRLAYIVERRQ